MIRRTQGSRPLHGNTSTNGISRSRQDRRCSLDFPVRPIIRPFPGWGFQRTDGDASSLIPLRPESAITIPAATSALDNCVSFKPVQIKNTHQASRITPFISFSSCSSSHPCGPTILFRKVLPNLPTIWGFIEAYRTASLGLIVHRVHTIRLPTAERYLEFDCAVRAQSCGRFAWKKRSGLVRPWPR